MSAHAARYSRLFRWFTLAAIAVMAACGGGSDPDIDGAASADAADSAGAVLVAMGTASADPTERALAVAALAVTTGGADTVYTEAGKLVRADPTIEALNASLFGEKVNLYDGTVEFVQTDATLPGNSALPLSVARRLTTGSLFIAGGIFGDWDLEIPRMQGVFAQSKGWTVGGVVTADLYKRCSRFGAPPVASGQSNHGTFNPEEYWHGHFLYAPGAGAQEVLKRTPATPSPTDGNAYPLTTKALWAIRCLPSMQRGTGEGFIAVSPDGTQYRFDWMVSRFYPSASKSSPSPEYAAAGRESTKSRSGAIASMVAASTALIAPPPEENLLAGYSLPRVEVWILPTLVTDRFGNTVTYTYNASYPWRVETIQGSDASGSPRVLTFSYANTTNANLVTSVTDGTRTWNYGYRSTAGGMVLGTVTQPDLSQWAFDLDALTMTNPGAGGGSCDEDGGLTAPGQGSIVHPSGASGTFALAGTQHGRSHVEKACRGDAAANATYALYPKFVDAFSIQSKTISGPGLPPATWTYAYGPANESFAPCAGCPETKTVTVTDPRSVQTRYTFGNRHRVSEGQLLQVDHGWTGTAAPRVVATQYRSPSAGPYADPVGTSPQLRTAGDLGYRHTPETLRTTTQQGVTFTWQANAFDEFARATSVTRSSSLGTSRTEATVYADNKTKWVLGQIGSVTEASTGSVVQSHTYDPVTASRTESYAFGLRTGRFTYNPDGTLLTHYDGRDLATTHGSYKRGLARTIAYADGTAESAVVNDIGLITSHTNPAGTTHIYAYDAMGRLASVTPPGGDPVAYLVTTQQFEKVAAAEYGLAAGHWRQTVSTGNARTLRYFDALWRERLSVTYDTANIAGTSKAVETRYDIDGRKTYVSYPQRAIAAIDTVTSGRSTTYYELGRVSRVVQDSELGFLTTSTDYLAAFQRRVTNPRGFVSTTSFHAWDSPTEDLVSGITAPEGVTVVIVRDVFGKPRSITRSGSHGGSTVSATRSYVYEPTYQRLCKTIEPESGATVQAHDGAGNVIWKASGLALPSTTSCDQAGVPAARQVSHSFDLRNRLTNTTYGDGSPAIGRSYTADGLLAQIWSGSSTWTDGYNNRRLLTSETLVLGSSYVFGRGIDAYGNVSSQSYPTGLSVDYGPNALGEPTQVSGFASGVTYHPNGAIAGYTLANGIVHGTTQNTRGLPLLWRDAGVVQDAYAYDANGNVAAITDQQEGLTTRSMGYDGLDRLVGANGIWGAGSFGYDPLDNLRTSAVGARTLVHTIDAATNRLASLSGSQTIGFGYDANGNVTARGTQGFVFDIGNRLSSAPGKASYAYDGHGRRTQMAFADGSWRLQFYSQAGKLLLGRHSSQGYTAHVYLGERLIAEVNDAVGTSYSHTDALGSPIARTNASGTILSRTRYEPYGATAAGTNPTGIGFTGHVNDADTGLVYMQQRYMDPIAGRFLSVDPVTTDLGTGELFNRYVYANNNPYRYTDPDGRLFFMPMLVGATAGAALNFGAQLYRAGGDLSQVSGKQVAVAAAAGALGGGAGVIANTATTTAGMIGANVVAGAGIGAVATQASAMVDGGTATAGQVAIGAGLGSVFSGGAGAVGAAPRAAAAAAASKSSVGEKNIAAGIAATTRSAGGSVPTTPAMQGAADALGASLANADNVRTAEPKKLDQK